MTLVSQSVLAIDPGVETGIAWTMDVEALVDKEDELDWDGKLNGWKQFDSRLFTAGEIGVVRELLIGIQRLDAMVDGLDTLILERFQLGGTRSMKDEVLSPARINAILEFEVRQQLPRTSIIYQTTSDKAIATDARLEEYGLLVKPKTKWRHANDAMRHLLHYALKQR